MKRVERQLQGELLSIFKKLIEEQNLGDTIAAVQEEGRSDILLVKAKTKKPILSLELKDPKSPEGKTVFNPKVFQRELKRAKQLGCEAFGISNFKETVIFSSDNPFYDWTQKNGEALNDSQIDYYRRNLKLTPDIEKGLKNIAQFVLDKALSLLRGTTPELEPPDERFIYKLKSLIEVYVPDIVYNLRNRYNTDSHFRKKVNDWFRKQLWTIPSSDEDFERLAHISLLMLVSKLIFYKALYDKKIYKSLPKLVIPETIKSSRPLKDYLFEEYFELLKKITGDFENLIGEPSDLLNEVPFITDATVDFVKSIVFSEEQYDFSKLPYDIVGRIFEELIREEERHKLGQYFTPSDVVNLINAFCIRTGNERVLDPTCGLGAFLVRAYERKKELTKKPIPNSLRKLWE